MRSTKRSRDSENSEKNSLEKNACFTENQWDMSEDGRLSCFVFFCAWFHFVCDVYIWLCSFHFFLHHLTTFTFMQLLNWNQGLYWKVVFKHDHKGFKLIRALLAAKPEWHCKPFLSPCCDDKPKSKSKSESYTASQDKSRRTELFHLFVNSEVLKNIKVMFHSIQVSFNSISRVFLQISRGENALNRKTL